MTRARGPRRRVAMPSVAAAVLALGLASPARAQRTMHAPLVVQLPLGPRALAMGGAWAGSRDAEAALGNPALAGGATQAAASGARYRGRVRGGAMGTNAAVGPMGVAMAVSYADHGPGSPDPRPARLRDDVLTLPRGLPGASLAAALAVSTAFKGVRWGAAATYLEERLGDERASVAALNLGAAKDGLPGGMTLGMAVQGIGPALRLAVGEYDLPLRVAAGFSGVSVPIGAWFDVTATGNLGVRRDGLVTGSLGGEVSWVPIEGIAVSMRAGARRAELTAQRPLTGGLGVTFDRLAVDYAWEQLRGGGAHRVGLRLR